MQRYIDFHWDYGYKAFLWANLLTYMTIFILLLATVVLIRNPEGTTETKARRWLLTANAVLILVYVPSFEAKQMYKKGRQYFT